MVWGYYPSYQTVHIVHASIAPYSAALTHKRVRHPHPLSFLELIRTHRIQSHAVHYSSVRRTPHKRTPSRRGSAWARIWLNRIPLIGCAAALGIYHLDMPGPMLRARRCLAACIRQRL